MSIELHPRHLTLRWGRAGTITFNLVPDVWARENTFRCVGKVFTYLGCNFILNFIKVDGTHYAWISVIGNSGMYSVDINVNVGLLRVTTQFLNCYHHNKGVLIECI